MSFEPNPALMCARCAHALIPGSAACMMCGHPVTAGPSSPAALPNPALKARLSPPPGLPMPAMRSAPVYPPGIPYGPVKVVSAKTPGIAAVLSVWLGVGHLYVGKNGPGFALLTLWGFLVLLSIVPFMMILTVPAWLITFIPTAISAANAAKDYNRRNGLIVR
jgi:TM2 domain-containing membrane protein YozV